MMAATSLLALSMSFIRSVAAVKSPTSQLCCRSRVKSVHANNVHLSRIRYNRSVIDAVVSELFRGGGDDQGPNYDNNYLNQDNYNGMNAGMNSDGPINAPNINQGPPSQIPQQTYQQPYEGGEGEFIGGYNSDVNFYQEHKESVEDRLAAWRLQQQVCSRWLHSILH